MSISKKAAPLVPALTVVSGRYTLRTESTVLWRYDYQIDAPGTERESRSGRLSLENADLSAAEPGDRLRTPWGMMQLAGSSLDDGWLLELSGCRPLEQSVGKLLDVPATALERGGTWRGAIGPWAYTIRTEAMGSKSELRVGELRHRRLVLVGEHQGDFVKTPWGPMRWMGPPNPEATTDYEQGFLLRGTFDRPLGDLQGELLEPKRAAVELRLESLYLEPAVKLDLAGRGARGVGLKLLRRDTTGPMLGTLTVDPNMCSLDDFGDRLGCTKMATRTVGVTITPQRLSDPKKLGRWFCEVRGEGLPTDLALILDADLERFVLKAENLLVPLFLDGDEG